MQITVESTQFGTRYKAERCSITRERRCISVLMLNEDVGPNPYESAIKLIAEVVPWPQPSRDSMLPFTVRTREHTTTVEFYLRCDCGVRAFGGDVIITPGSDRHAQSCPEYTAARE